MFANPFQRNRFASLEAEVVRLTKMVQQREKEKSALTREAELREEIEDLRDVLGISGY